MIGDDAPAARFLLLRDDWTTLYRSQDLPDELPLDELGVGGSKSNASLLFVAVSINFELMMKPQIVLRIGKAFLTLIGVLFYSSCCLIPHQRISTLGIELALLASCFWVSLTIAEKRVVERK